MSKIFGKRLMNAIRMSGMIQEEIAQKVGVDRSTISHWIHNRHAPNPNQIKILAETLNVTTDYLLGLDDEQWISRIPLKLKEFIRDEIMDGNEYLTMANYIKEKKIDHNAIRGITDTLAKTRDELASK